MNAKNLIIPLLLVLFCCMLGCRNKQHNKVNENVRDLSQIKDSGELVVLTLYSSTSYFNYRGQEMGFQYELFRAGGYKSDRNRLVVRCFFLLSAS